MEQVFSKYVSNWTEIDGVQYALMISLGLTNEKDFQKVKHVFWTKNILGDELYKMVMSLVKMGYLLYDEENELFKYNEAWFIP